ncbi:hypothetical protein [Aliiruegeria lutimaris]|uniref:hypothetical protein n=1 Tax=Aliiruegeria lutimaris TaxID=571298 RepID=UPI0011140F7F|nr:hypothetical protein [Aliiruegeria lutimaris]
MTRAPLTPLKEAAYETRTDGKEGRLLHFRNRDPVHIGVEAGIFLHDPLGEIDAIALDDLRHRAAIDPILRAKARLVHHLPPVEDGSGDHSIKFVEHQIARSCRHHSAKGQAVTISADRADFLFGQQAPGLADDRFHPGSSASGSSETPI